MIILNDGTYFEIDDEYSIYLQQSYPGLDVHLELLAMAAWSDANPQKRKTRKGIKRFITAWLNRARDQGGSPFAQKDSTESRTVPMKKWTQLDDLTHDFMQSESFRNACLAKFGQYVTYSGERVTNGAALDGAEQVPGGGVLQVHHGESEQRSDLRDSQTYENE